jgi:hypothetical protein
VTVRRGYSIHVGVGHTTCVHPDGIGYNLSAIRGVPQIANDMAEIAKRAGYQSRALLVTQPFGSIEEAIAARSESVQAAYDSGHLRRATKANFLAAVDDAIQRIEQDDQLLITFAGHGAKQFDPTDPTRSESGWVFEDEHCWDSEIEAKLNSTARNARILVISESCHSGSLTVEGDVSDYTKRLVGEERFKPSIIQIGAAYDSERAHIVNGEFVFTSCLKGVWASGSFRGGHPAFTSKIRQQMRERFSASGSGTHWQEPRYLATGPNEDSLHAFELSTPFLLHES